MTNDITALPSILPRPEIAEHPIIGADGLPQIRRSRRGLSRALRRRHTRFPR